MQTSEVQRSLRRTTLALYAFGLSLSFTACAAEPGEAEQDKLTGAEPEPAAEVGAAVQPIINGTLSDKQGIIGIYRWNPSFREYRQVCTGVAHQRRVRYRQALLRAGGSQ